MTENGYESKLEFGPEYKGPLLLSSAVACAVALAAYEAAKWNGRMEKNTADKAATEALRKYLGRLPFSATVKIGEGERDKAPMLYVGETLGSVRREFGREFDIAVDPLEGTNFCAKGQPGALATLAIAPGGTIFTSPDIYFYKIAGPPSCKGKLSFDKSTAENIQVVADALEKPVDEVVVCVMERERNRDLIQEVLDAGARVSLITDGDVYGCIATILENSGIDLYLGIGAAPEGVLAASALKTVDGEFIARPWFGDLALGEIEEKARAAGISPDQIFTIDDLIASDEVMFLAAGVTNGPLVPGVEFFNDERGTVAVVHVAVFMQAKDEAGCYGSYVVRPIEIYEVGDELELNWARVGGWYLDVL